MTTPRTSRRRRRPRPAGRAAALAPGLPDRLARGQYVGAARLHEVPGARRAWRSPLGQFWIGVQNWWRRATAARCRHRAHRVGRRICRSAARCVFDVPGRARSACWSRRRAQTVRRLQQQCTHLSCAGAFPGRRRGRARLPVPPRLLRPARPAVRSPARRAGRSPRVTPRGARPGIYATGVEARTT